MKTANSTAKKLTSLQISVMGLNELNKYVIEQLTALLPQINGYVGQKILLSGGDLAAKFKVSKPGQVKEKKNLYFLDNHGYFDPSTSSLWIKFRTCINGGSYENRTAFTEYFDQHIYIGNIENNVLMECKGLKDILKSYELRTDLTVSEIKYKINMFEQAKSEAEMCLKSIPVHIQKSQYLKL